MRCNIEKLQLSDKQQFDPCLALYLIVAWRILFMAMLGRASPTLKTIAQLGGFIGRKHGGDPGPIVMWKGLRNLYEHIRAREAFSRAFGHTISNNITATRWR